MKILKLVWKFTSPLLIGLGMGAAFCGWLALSLIIVCATLFLGWIDLIIHKKLSKVSLLTMIAVIALAILASQSSYSQEPPEQQVIVEIVCGVLVLLVGIVFMVGIYKLAKKIPKCETPPEPPANTNAPPKYDGPITKHPVTFNFDDTAALVEDISDYATNAAFADPSGGYYEARFRFKYRWTTNGVEWTTNSIESFISRHWQHVTQGTNSMLVPRPFLPKLEDGLPVSEMLLLQPLPQ